MRPTLHPHPPRSGCASPGQPGQCRRGLGRGATPRPAPPRSLPPGQPVDVSSLASILQAAARGEGWAGGAASPSAAPGVHAGAGPAALATPSPPPAPLPSTVYLVGTGPGDPGLLTLAALQLMATASIVLVDRLVSPDVLALVRPGAAIVDVGKEAGLHTLAQPAIAAALITAARAQQEEGGGWRR